MSDANDDEIAALEQFVVENDELLELEARIGRFNIFDALRIERTEIRHSNFLAWLLDPSESHGQGDLFLKAVLMDMLRLAPRSRRPLSPATLDGVELHDVEVRREYRNIDLLIRSDEPSFVVAVENKIDSGEHSNQLDRYERTVRREFPDAPSLHVFLTPDGSAATDEDWVTYGYADLHRVLTRVQRTAAGSLGGDVGVFLTHYLDLIGSRLMIDPSIDELCRKIYSKHRRAIDLIVERMPTPGFDVVETVRAWIRERPELWIPREIGNRLAAQCVPASWRGVLSSSDGFRLPSSPCDLFIDFECGIRREHYLAARLVVGNGEQNARLEVMKRIADLMPDQQAARKQVTTSLTRLGSKTLLSWKPDEEPEEAGIRAAVAGYMESVSEGLSKLPSLLTDMTAHDKSSGL